MGSVLLVSVSSSREPYLEDQQGMRWRMWIFLLNTELGGVSMVVIEAVSGKGHTSCLPNPLWVATMVQAVIAIASV